MPVIVLSASITARLAFFLDGAALNRQATGRGAARIMRVAAMPSAINKCVMR